jgi:hypothetical protein
MNMTPTIAGELPLEDNLSVSSQLLRGVLERHALRHHGLEDNLSVRSQLLRSEAERPAIRLHGLEDNLSVTGNE